MDDALDYLCTKYHCYFPRVDSENMLKISVQLPKKGS